MYDLFIYFFILFCINIFFVILLTSFTVSYWNYAENRRAVFCQFAKIKGFDPLVPENWYQKSMEDFSALAVIFLKNNFYICFFIISIILLLMLTYILIFRKLDPCCTTIMENMLRL